MSPSLTDTCQLCPVSPREGRSIYIWHKAAVFLAGNFVRFRRVTSTGERNT